MEGIFQTETGNFVSVIRFQGITKVTSPCQITCEAAKLLQCQVDLLQTQIQARHEEFKETEHNNTLLHMTTTNMHAAVKIQEQEVASLKNELETISRTTTIIQEWEGNLIAQYEAAVSTNFGQNVPPMSPIEPIEPPVAQQVQVLGNSNQNQNLDALIATGSNQQHGEDLTKLSEIYCVCGVKFTTKQNRREHIKYYTLRMNFQCSECGIRKFGLNQLRTHMKVTHGMSTTDLASLKGCRMCGQLFPNMAELHDHRRTKHAPSRLNR